MVVKDVLVISWFISGSVGSENRKPHKLNVRLRNFQSEVKAIPLKIHLTRQLVLSVKGVLRPVLSRNNSTLHKR